MQRAVPLLFVQGPWLRSSVWTTVRALLGQQGWETRTLDVFDQDGDSAVSSSLATVRGQVSLLNKSITNSYPPVVVAHSTSCVVAQKYLESFSFSGLILVAPIPPTPTFDGSIQRLLEVDHALVRDLSTASNPPASARHRELEQLMYGPAAAMAAAAATDTTDFAAVSQERFLQDVAGTIVNLEPQPVPMQLICGTEDKVVTPQCVSSVVLTCHIQSFETAQRARTTCTIIRAEHLHSHTYTCAGMCRVS